MTKQRRKSIVYAAMGQIQPTGSGVLSAGEDLTSARGSAGGALRRATATLRREAASVSRRRRSQRSTGRATKPRVTRSTTEWFPCPEYARVPGITDENAARDRSYQANSRQPETRKGSEVAVPETPEIHERPAQSYAGVRYTATMDRIGQTIGDGLPELFAWLGRNQLRPNGAPFVRYHVVDMDVSSSSSWASRSNPACRATSACKPERCRRDAGRRCSTPVLRTASSRQTRSCWRGQRKTDMPSTSKGHAGRVASSTT